jgi:hypothetical protein
VAWVESPLQLLCAAEYAAELFDTKGGELDVVFRLTGPQMTATAAALIERGARFRTIAPYYGIPWAALASRRDWVIGDGFSGQFRLALSTVGARQITFVDDGRMTIDLVEAVRGDIAFARPGHDESAAKTFLGESTRSRLRRLANRGRLTFYSAFADRIASSGPGATLRIRPNRFDWLRAHARPVALPHLRVVLGSAGIADGTIDPSRYLDWLARIAANGSLSYLPHRRESRELLSIVDGIDGVRVVETDLPVELALAGTADALQIISLGSTADTTLARILAGTGTAVHVLALDGSR